MAVTAAVFVRGLVQKAGYLKYPFLASAVVAGWFIPQALSLAADKTLPEGGYDLTMIYAAASLIAAVLGERWVSKLPTDKKWNYDERRLAIGAAVLSLIGAFAFSLTQSTTRETTVEGLTTGVITIYYFLFTLQYMGLAIALLLLLRKFSWFTFAIVAFDYSTILAFVLFGGRRGAAMDISFITICAFWFVRGILLPRLAMIGGVVLGTLMVNVVGEYRRMVTLINANSSEPRLPTLSEFMDMPFLETFSKVTFEVRNAIFYISSAVQNGSYDFGLHYWNFFVFRYIPGQIVGQDLKQWLMFDLPNDPSLVFDYKRHIGTTYTGFADTFGAFSFFGVLVFAGISALMHRWWRSGMAGNFESRLIYIATVGTAMQSITHSTEWFFIYLPQLFIFTWPILYWARQSRASDQRIPGVGRTSSAAKASNPRYSHFRPSQR